MIKTVKINSMGEEPKERKYWLTRPAVERFQALEQMRQSFYDNSSKGFQRVYELLNKNNVRYIVIGGYAVVYHGYVRSTNDIDIWIDIRKDNIRKVIKTLDEFGFSSLNIKETDFSPNQIIPLGYPPNRIDLITTLAGIDFETCYESKEQVTIDHIAVNIIDLENLIKAKKASNRTRDLADIEELT